MELLLKISDPLFSEIDREARFRRLSLESYAQQVLECHAAESRLASAERARDESETRVQGG